MLYLPPFVFILIYSRFSRKKVETFLIFFYPLVFFYFFFPPPLTLFFYPHFYQFFWWFFLPLFLFNLRKNIRDIAKKARRIWSLLRWYYDYRLFQGAIIFKGFFPRSGDWKMLHIRQRVSKYANMGVSIV